MPALPALVTSATVLALGLAACGGSSGSSSGSSSSAAAPAGAYGGGAGAASSTSTAATTSSASAAAPVHAAATKLALAVAPGGALAFDRTSLHAAAGRVSIAFTNGAPLGHNLTITGPGGSVVGATPTFQGGTRALVANLKPGTYTFFCSVPGHRAAGMQGTLTVS